MTGLDKYRLTVAVVLGILGVVIIARGITSGVWPVGVVGLVMLALAGYRVNQYRTYRMKARR